METEKAVLAANGFKEFNPVQKEVLKKEWKEKSLVVSSPTASGKTVVAELLALNSVLSKKRKAIYTCPLRALASEHFADFRKKYSELGIRFAVSTGDLDSSSKHLQDYDVIFTTYEKLDSLIRHRAEWLNSIGLLVVDEVHELDSNRGPTLEIAACKLMQMNPGMQTLALSATIPNASEIADWLQAELIESDYRPIPLHEGVYFNQEVRYAARKPEHIEGKSPIEGIVANTLHSNKKQAMAFASTRRNAEALATRLSGLSEKSLGKAERNALEGHSEKILSVLEQPTEQCRKLASLVKKGAAFHHAGLLHRQRSVVEQAFRENNLKLIAATPTLAAGVNLPSHTIVIHSLYRFEAWGMSRIPVREVKQMLGRAGRPKYDSEGRGILIAKSEPEADELMDSYLNGSLEEITSKLGVEPVLRMHLLSLVASHFVFDLHSMEQFFSQTFYGKQFGSLSELFGNLQDALRQLHEWGFIEGEEERFSATPLGKRVSELYLDPATAFSLVQAMGFKKKFSALSYLFLFTASSEFMPWLSVPKRKEPELWEQLQLHEKFLPIDINREMYLDLNILKKFNSALLLEEWVSEKQEPELLKEFNTQPGILHGKLRICDWLAYSSLELAKLLSLEQHFSPISRLRKRLKYGIKEELLPLCEVRYIGRVRARRLWRANIRTVAQLKKADVFDLGRVLGKGVAEKVKLQLVAGKT